MTVKERIDAIVANGWPIAFDGCHKIYLLTSKEREDEARGLGYDVYGAGELPSIWENSCSLKFISQWGLYGEGNAGFRHDLEINQFDEEGESELEEESANESSD